MDSGFTHLLNAGVIQPDPEVLDELVAEAMKDTLGDTIRYVDSPQASIKIDPEEPAQSQD